MGRTLSVPELPPFDARSFTQRLHERVLKGEGFVEVPDATGAVKRYSVQNTSGRYVSFDPAAATSFDKFVIGLRGQQDVVERLDVQASDQKEHLDRLDVRESAHHAAQDARLDALEAAHRPFGSGSG